jgi:hypothetical protein
MPKPIIQIVTILTISILVGCTVSPTITATIKSSSIPLTATTLPEGRVIIQKTPLNLLGGTLYGHGKIAVILASRGGYSETEWSAFAQVLAGEGFTALTMGSQDDEGVTILNVGYAIDFLKRNGFDKIICIGASNGASGCAYNATRPEIVGLVLVTYHGNADLSKATLPKLFIAAEQDAVYRPRTEQGYQAAADPKALIIVPGTAATGPALLDSSGGGDLQTNIVDFVEQCVGQ